MPYGVPVDSDVGSSHVQQHGSELTSDYYDCCEVEVYEPPLPDEDYEAALFTDGLNNRRYAAMKVVIVNGTTNQKKTLTRAYHQAMKRIVLNENDGKKQSGVLAANFYVTEKPQSPRRRKILRKKSQQNPTLLLKEVRRGESQIKRQERKEISFHALPASTLERRALTTGPTSARTRARQCPSTTKQ